MKHLKLCYNCLSANHLLNNCRSETACRHCNSYHHSSICFKNYPTKPAKEESKPNSTTTSAATCVKTSCALPIAAIPIQTKTQGIKTYKALFDQCAQRTLLLKTIAKHLKIISRKNCELSIDGFQTQGKVQKYEVVTFQVNTGQFLTNVEAVLVDKLPSRINIPGLLKI